MGKVGIKSTDKGIVIAAEDQKTFDAAITAAQTALANQAAYMSVCTGLSMKFCAKIALHRMERRMAA